MTSPDEPRLARGIRSFTRVTVGAVLAVGDQASTIANRAAGDGGSGANGDDTGPKALTTGADDARWRHLLIGTAFAVEDRAVDLSQVASRAAGRVTPVAGWFLASPILTPARRRVETTLEGLIERGRIEEDLGRDQAGQLLNGTIETVVASPKLAEIVNDVVGQVLEPILDQAMPTVLGNLAEHPEMLSPTVNAVVAEVLTPILDSAMPTVLDSLKDDPDQLVPLVNAIVGKALDPIMAEALPKVLGDIEKQPEMMVPLVQALVGEILEPVLNQALPQVIDVLNEDPDAIRSLVRDQSTGMAADMAHTVRAQAAGADDRIDRIARKVLRRKAPRELEQPAQTALPPGPA